MKHANHARASERAACVRTALLLALIAAMSFGSVIIAQSLGMHP